MNGRALSVDTIRDNTNEKEYWITAELTADLDLHRFPFDRHIIKVEIEPKLMNKLEMVLVIDQANSGIDPEADLPGWGLEGTSSDIFNRTYVPGEVSYSRAVFGFGIEGGRHIDRPEGLAPDHAHHRRGALLPDVKSLIPARA